MRILGLDIGQRRIGVALSDPEQLCASALTVIERKNDTTALLEIMDIAEKHQVERIVIGLPRSLDGSIGPQAQKVQAFAKKLSQQLPVESWDEWLSTAAAERLLLAAGVRREQRKKHRDALAATIILQSYLDRLRSGTAGG